MNIDQLESLNKYTEEAIKQLDLVILILPGQPVGQDFFRGMINRIKSERKRIQRQVAREEK